jgi:hypothetical protein
MMKTDPKQAADYKSALIGTWTDDDEQIFSRYREQNVKRGLIKQGDSGNKTLGGMKAR